MPDRKPSARPSRRDNPARRLRRLWRHGKPPDLLAFIDESAPLSSSQALELAQIDQQGRWRRGERPLAEDYLNRLPMLAADGERSLDLIYGEFLLREAMGESPSWDDFAQRFPEHAESLKLQLALHRAMDDEVNTGPDPLPEIPGYSILREIGRGSNGVVYEARQKGLDRIVAVKLLPAAAFSAPTQRGRFEAEARAVARLQHPNIVEIHEVGETDGAPYLVLAFASGGSLADHLDGSPWPPEIAARLIETLARATEHAHASGVIHRDLKPGNILLALQNSKVQKRNEHTGSVSQFLILNFAFCTPKITDFGLAKLQGDIAAPTCDGTVLGTPGYMAPEQARGEIGGVGPAADVYALGAMLYELLTGRPPFKAATPLATLQQMLAAEPAPPHRIVRELPRDLETVCMKCLEKDPARRYASAAELADDLARYLAREPVRARPIGAISRFRRWCGRRPAQAAALGLAAAAILATLVVGGIYTVERSLAARRLETALNTNRRLLARSAIDRGIAQCEQGQVGRGLLLLSQGLTGAERAGLTDLAQVARANLGAWSARHHHLRESFDLRDKIQAVGFWPDGTTLVAVTDRSQVFRWDGAHNTTKHVKFVAPHGTYRAAFSPDGKFLVFAYSDNGKDLFRIIDLNNDQMLLNGVQLPCPIYSVAFAPNGQFIAFGGDNGSISRFDTASGRHLGTVQAHDKQVTVLGFSPDSSRLASASEDNTTRIATAASGWQPGTLLPHPGGVSALAFSPDGRQLVTGGYDLVVRLWNVADLSLIGDLFSGGNTVRRLAFSPDGTRLASAGLATAVQIWDVAHRVPVGPLLPHTQAIAALAFRDDGRQLLTGSEDGTVRLWQLSQPLQPEPIFSQSSKIRTIVRSTDGRHFLTGSEGGGARYWNRDGSPRTPPLPFNLSVEVAAISADDRVLLAASHVLGKGGMVQTWDAATGNPRASALPTFYEADAVMDRNGTTIATTTEDSRAQLWNAQTGQRIGPRLGVGPIWSYTFSPSGDALVTCCKDGPPRWWSPKTGEPIRSPLTVDETAEVARFTPDGQKLLTARDDGLARFWNMPDGQPIGEPFAVGRLFRLAFRPDSKVMMTASFENVARLWDTSTARLIGSPLQHAGQIRAMDFSPDGQLAATGSYDRSVRLWDASTGQPIGPPLWHGHLVWYVVFDGNSIIVGGEEPVARRWPLTAPLGGTSEQVALWVQVVTGIESDNEGGWRVLSTSAWKERRAKLEASGFTKP